MNQSVLSRETIQLMMQSQRMIQKEFGVRIQLHDEQAIARLIAYAAQSKNDELKACSAQLMQQLAPGTGSDSATDDVAPEPMASTARNIYRGCEIEAEAAPEPVAVEEQNSAAPRNKVIYRGRRVG